MILKLNPRCSTIPAPRKKISSIPDEVSHLSKRRVGKQENEKYLAKTNTLSSGMSREFSCPSLPANSKWNKSLITKNQTPVQPYQWWATYKPAFLAVSAKASAIAGKAAEWQSGHICVNHVQMMLLSRKMLEMVNKTSRSLRGWDCWVCIRCFSLTKDHCSMLLCSVICHN